jgi:type IV pilus assembly protein PilM
MGWAFINKSARQTDEIVAISLGSRTTNAVLLRQAGERIVLKNYVSADAPIYDKSINAEILADHLQEVHAALETKTTQVVLVLSAGDVLLRQAEMPVAPPGDMRRLLKFNSKNVLQEELPGHTFDCFMLPSDGQETFETSVADDELFASKGSRGGRRAKVLVGGVKDTLLEEVLAAARAAKLNPTQILPAQSCPANAMAVLPEEFRKGSIALIDFGFRHSSISLVNEGRLVLSRVVNIGGDKLTAGLAEAMNVSYSAAEGVKTMLAEKVQAKLETLLAPLVDELQNSIAYVEGIYHDSKVSKVLISGGSARSNTIIQSLAQLTHLSCTRWNPLSYMDIDLPKHKAASVDRDSPQLITAVGAGITCFFPGLVKINLLAEQQEAEELRRRDPVRRSKWVALSIVTVLLLWAAQLGVRLVLAGIEYKRHASAKETAETKMRALTLVSRQSALADDQRERIERIAAGRFLGADLLNALQEAVVDDIQLVHISVDIQTRMVDPPPSTKGSKDPFPVETVLLTLQGKDYGNPPSLDTFIDRMVEVPYFKQHLRKTAPVKLVDRSPSQVDPSDVTKSFILFTVECTFAERPL